jgi:hypothetical protein
MLYIFSRHWNTIIVSLTNRFAQKHQNITKQRTAIHVHLGLLCLLPS